MLHWVIPRIYVCMYIYIYIHIYNIYIHIHVHTERNGREKCREKLFNLVVSI